nr:FAD synthase-like [Ipomoea batatas]
MGSSLCKKLHSIGWAVSHLAVTRNDVDSVAEEVERRKSTNDMVFIYGGVGPLHSDVTVAGVAKAFGVRLVSNISFVFITSPSQNFWNSLLAYLHIGCRISCACI